MSHATRAIIHVGMPKTGTSSIQDTFFKFKHPGFEYVDWSAGNHSALFVLLFENEDKLERFHSFAARGPEFIRELPLLRAKVLAQLEDQIAVADGKTLLFSAEAISQPQFVQANHRLAAFFRDRSDRSDVIGYARPPAGFMASAFQQYLKGGAKVALPFPTYRARFEQIDAAFGRDNVTIRAFSRDRLIGGDVVRDFAETTGIAMPPEDRIVRSNESLSREATALLYVQRKFGVGFVQGFNRAHMANNEFIASLAAIGTGKLAFSDAMMAPLLVEMADDIAWMEDRLGHPLSEAGSTSPDAISSLDDLVDIALQNYEKLLETLGKNAPKAGPATVGNLVKALEALRELSYENVLPEAARKAAAKAAARAHNIGRSRRNLEMANKAEKPSEEELALRRKMANILWHLDMGENIPATPEERAEAFKSARDDYMKKAAKFARQLANNKLSLVETMEHA